MSFNARYVVCFVSSGAYRANTRRQYVNAVIFGAPFVPTVTYLDQLPYGRPGRVYHGPATSYDSQKIDPYGGAKSLGIFHQIHAHQYSHINAGEIVMRVLKNRAEFEARQKAKTSKADTEEALHLREQELVAAEQKVPNTT